jgi:hypothetical protein
MAVEPIHSSKFIVKGECGISLMRGLAVTASALVLVTLLYAKAPAFDEAMYQIRWAEKKNEICVKDPFHNKYLQTHFSFSTVFGGCLIFLVTEDGVFENVLISKNHPPRKTGDCLGTMDGGAENGARIGLVPCLRLQTPIWRLTKEGYLQGINQKCMKRNLDGGLFLWDCKQPPESERMKKKRILERLPTTKWFLKKLTD